MDKPIGVGDFAQMVADLGRLLAEATPGPWTKNIAPPESIRALLDALWETQSALVECADDLESEVEHRYQGIKDHPAMTPKYERDMGSVVAARAVLSRYPMGIE